jgi:acyl phosphate:glycerol-3-phosphate acyltransferase
MPPLVAHVLLSLGAYLIGSIPFGYLLVRAVRGIDLRTVGSGNIGATNVSRALGLKWGFVALALDFGKGFGPAQVLAPLAHAHLVPHRSELLLALIYGACAIGGHLFPIYLKFHGGKGVATSAGVLAGAITWPVLLAAGVWGIALTLTHRVSAASMMAALSLPVLASFSFMPMGTEGDPSRVLRIGFCSVVTLMVLWCHRTNFKRIRDGTEPRIGRRNA